MNHLASSLLDTPKPKRFFPMARLLRHAPGVKPLLECYQGLPLTDGSVDFAGRILEALNITTEMLSGTFDSLPASGPLILAANHPFGAVEGLVLAALGLRMRPDFKILVNHMLCRIPELRHLFIPVNVFSGKGGPDNVPSLREALSHLEKGGLLAVFPSGVVSHWHLRERRVLDPEWNSLVGRLARLTNAPIVPLYFEGRNSLLFQAAGCVHPILRTLLLPRELWRQRGRKICLRVGEIVEPGLLRELRDDKKRTAYIRARCYALGRTRAHPAWPIPIASSSARGILEEEIRLLPPQSLLVQEGRFRTFCVAPQKSPHLIRELGRLRESTFRTVHEGSGRALDLDRFDPHYIHLVLWDEAAGSIAGGYRARCIFPPISLAELKTLYTASLFRFKGKFFERCGISMELGRAFVASDYQRDYAPLLMLWKGIARLAARFRARTLFGSSSIGRMGYAPESIFMLCQHLEEFYAAPGLAGLVEGRCRPKPYCGINTPDARGLEYKVLDRAVKGFEGGKGLPVLFKQYLQLGGRIAGFHEDRGFGTLDALMVVDLAAAPEKLLLRYMGEEGLRLMRLAHGRPSADFFDLSPAA